MRDLNMMHCTPKTIRTFPKQIGEERDVIHSHWTAVMVLDLVLILIDAKMEEME